MDVLQKLHKLIEERGWTQYRLSRESGIHESTISNIFRRNTLPTIPTLEAMCRGFGITLSQFFSEGDLIEITPEIQALIDAWTPLTPEQKETVMLVARMAKNQRVAI